MALLSGVVALGLGAALTVNATACAVPGAAETTKSMPSSPTLQPAGTVTVTALCSAAGSEVLSVVSVQPVSAASFGLTLRVIAASVRFVSPSAAVQPPSERTSREGDRLSIVHAALPAAAATAPNTKNKPAADRAAAVRTTVTPGRDCHSDYGDPPGEVNPRCGVRRRWLTASIAMA